MSEKQDSEQAEAERRKQRITEQLLESVAAPRMSCSGAEVIDHTTKESDSDSEAEDEYRNEKGKQMEEKILDALSLPIATHEPIVTEVRSRHTRKAGSYSLGSLTQRIDSNSYATNRHIMNTMQNAKRASLLTRSIELGADNSGATMFDDREGQFVRTKTLAASKGNVPLSVNAQAMVSPRTSLAAAMQERKYKSSNEHITSMTNKMSTSCASAGFSFGLKDPSGSGSSGVSKSMSLTKQTYKSMKQNSSSASAGAKINLPRLVDILKKWS